MRTLRASRIGGCAACGARVELQASAEGFSVAPRQAIDFMRRKLRVPTERWDDLWQEMHTTGFMVAGAQSDALLKDFHTAVTAAIEEGRTLEQFRQDFDRIVDEHGWSYNGSRNWRSRVIFETNMRTAYAAGRWEQIETMKDDRPYLRYVAVMDERTRPEHAEWHDTVLPVDDEFWQTHFPPNGWNCRCTVQNLSARDLDRYGLEVSERPAVEMIERTAGGRTIMVPKGIDPGFAYRPGTPPSDVVRRALESRAAP